MRVTMKLRSKTTKLALSGGLLLLILMLVSWQSGIAQPPTRYVYDENGRLRAVIAPNGEAGIYEYDPAGNITTIRRLAADALEIIDFSPRRGVPGQPVRIYGVGFGNTVSAVLFNGASAKIISQSNNLVVVEVPEGATTGTIALTSPRGTTQTATPFTISGVRLRPLSLTLLPSQIFQFTAEIIGSADQRVKWFVNDTPGGSAQTGTISADGLYVAPNLSASLAEFTISAESLALPGLRGEAQVIVKDNIFLTLSQGVSVRYGTPNTTSVYAALSEGVSVRYGNAPPTATAYTPIANALSVRYGTPSNTNAAYTPIADALSVRYGNAPTTASAYTPIAVALSVRYGEPPGGMNQTPAITSVSVTSGAVINAIMPASLARGGSATVNISGVNLAGASALRFFNADGTVAVGVTATNINANANGAAVTTTITVATSATAVPKILVLTTPAGRSQTSNLGSNVLVITQ